MLYVRTGSKQTQDTGAKNQRVTRKPETRNAREETGTPIGVVLLVLALIAVAIIGLIVLHQLPPSFTGKISEALQKQALPAQAVPILTLLRDQIESLVSILRAYFILLIVTSGVLLVLHRYAYGAAIAIFFVFALSFFSLGAQSAALQQNVSIPDAVAIGQTLSKAYTTAAGFNLFIILVLALLYRAYMRAWQDRWC
jgi:hypothetical protein